MFKVSELVAVTGGNLISQADNIIVSGISIDSRTIKSDQVFLAIKGDNFDGHDFIEAVIRKGVKVIIAEDFKAQFKNNKSVAIILVKDTVKALGRIANFHRKKFDLPVIAVTGSNGKTTTKEMISWVLSKKYKVLKNEGTKNNHIGLPLTLLNLNSTHDIVVVEIGTNHFGEIGYLTSIACPNIGVITNIGPSHLAFLKSLKGILSEKCSLLKGLSKPGIAILNYDDPLLRKEALKFKKDAFLMGVGYKNNADFKAKSLKSSCRGIEFTVNKKFKFTLGTLGYYNMYNALNSIAIGRIFGMAYPDIIALIRTFSPPKSRLNFKELEGIRFIDDTYNSNPLSLKQALGVLKDFKVRGRKIFIMGDMLELGRDSKSFHIQAIKDALKICDNLVTVGIITGSLKKVFSKERGAFFCKDSLQAKDFLFNNLHVTKDDIVLVKGSRAIKTEEVFKI